MWPASSARLRRRLDLATPGSQFLAGKAADPAFRADVISRIPLGRVGRVEDITTAVVFLASDAAGLITGSSLLIDGGYTAQ